MATAEALITENIDLWTAAVRRKSSAGRGTGKKIELYGIKKLRELILEMAVRGLLVPQDPTDEPASVLLERIAAEKAELVKDKKIKKQKALPPISDEEKPFELPKGWEWTRLSEIGYTQTGGTPKKVDTHHYGKLMPFIKPGDIFEGEILSYSRDALSQEGVDSLGRLAPADSVLMVCIGTIGKCARTEKTVSFNQQINSISPYLKIGEYVLKALQASYFQKAAWNLSSSTTIAILNKGKWGQIPIPLAPEKEQHRIVAKVDELMALCDQLEQQTEANISAHQTLVETLLAAVTGNDANAAESIALLFANFDSLFTTENSVDQLKQTILQLAVMGKLVPQDPNDEPASVLLEKIAAEKEKLVKEKKIKKQKALPPIEDEEKPFELPVGWQPCRLQDVTKLITDGKHGDCNNLPGSGYYFLSAKDIQDGMLCYENAREIVPVEFQEVHQRTNLEGGDICLVNTGATVGKLAVTSDSLLTSKTTFQKSVAVIKPVKPFCSELYLALFLKAEAKNLLKKSGGSAINNLLLGDLKKKVFFLPPKAEQHRIVTKVDELMTLCDQLKTRLNTAQTTQLHLADTVADQAIV